MSSSLPGLLSGVAFGAALTASGVYQPSVIISQLRFEDWHMLQSFLTATASSAVLIALVRRLGYANPAPRSYSSVALLGHADANVIGGALLGTGMALSGSCPGTVMSQVAVGIPSGYWTFAGGAVGGLVWTGVLRSWAAGRKKLQALREQEKTATADAADAGAATPGDENQLKQASPSPPPRPKFPGLTIHEHLGISYAAALIGFEALVVLVVRSTLGAGTSASLPLEQRHPIPPVVGGLLIAGAQLFSILTRKTLVGTSTVFEEVGDHVWWLFGGCKECARPTARSALIFVAGLMAGAWGISRAVPSLVGAAALEVAPLNAFLGGISMIVGARLAGGCTSGHGLSGISMLCVSSIVTIASAFVAGGLVSRLLA